MQHRHPERSHQGRRPRPRRSFPLRRRSLGVLATAFLLLAADAPSTERMPTYDAEGRLELPTGYEQWVFVGSSLGLSYSDGAPGMEMFHHTLMEPSAYRHFQATGTFREGTMLALLLHGTGSGVLPARQGRFAAEVHAVELAVKDSDRVPETWAYYNFGGMNGLRSTAEPLPAASCQQCHVEHAAHDNVFVQFYPLLVDAAPAGTLPDTLPGALPRRAQHHQPLGGSMMDGSNEPRRADAAPEETPPDDEGPRLALGGADPVHLVEGRSELGKPEIVEVVDGMRYQFVSEPSRATFVADPQSFVIRNTTCPVVPGAPIDPAITAVHAGSIYAFATADCRTDFEADPARYVETP